MFAGRHRENGLLKFKVMVYIKGNIEERGTLREVWIRKLDVNLSINIFHFSFLDYWKKTFNK